MRLLRPSTWPVALKLSLLFLGVALVPLCVTAAYNLRQSLGSVRHTAHLNLELFAGITAARLDQLITDTGRTAAQIAGDAEVVAILSSAQGDPGTRSSVQRTLENVVRTNPDIFSVFLLDKDGLCIAGTHPENLGQRYSYRSYYRGALEHGAYVSELLTGSTTGRPGVFFSHAIRDAAGSTVGVVVLKLEGESLWGTVDSLRVGERGRALVVDEYGVVISHTDRALLYHSLAPLPAEVRSQPVFQQRFTSVGVVQIPSLGLESLGRAMTGARGPGHIHYADGERGPQIVGYAPMKTRPWTVGVEVPDHEFSAPLKKLARGTLLSVLAVGLVVTLLALAVAHRLVRPLHELTRAASAVERGRFEEARVDVQSEDELGALSRAFNTMASGLAERERERDIFGRVVSPEVREKLLAGNLRLGGETRWVAVLFSDIRGFSTLSEKMAPQKVVELLNEYLTEMAAAVRPFNGYINNFIGDAIVVIFGAPMDQPDVERRAIRAARAMQEALAALNARRAARGDFTIGTGIGICAGEVVAGQIGSMERLLYTVIGDTVNVAARLESLTREYPDHGMLVSRSVADGLKDEPGVRLVGLGLIHVKGRAEPVDVYAVHADAPAAREAGGSGTAG